MEPNDLVQVIAECFLQLAILSEVVVASPRMRATSLRHARYLDRSTDSLCHNLCFIVVLKLCINFGNVIGDKCLVLNRPVTQETFQCFLL